jgi:hypothetical protein
MDVDSARTIIDKWCKSPPVDGLHVNTVSWNDMSRGKKSSGGYNITDQTLSINTIDKEWIRCPLVKNSTNFEDKTTDQNPESFYLMDKEERVSLKNYISNLDKIHPKLTKLWDVRDEKAILTQHHHTILPLPYGIDSVEFTANCSSYTNGQTPSVLCIYSTSTSSTPQLLTRWGQELYINKDGKSLTSKASSAKDKTDNKDNSDNENNSVNNKVILYQIPIITTNKSFISRVRRLASESKTSRVTRGITRGTRGMEDADIEEGEDVGAFTGLDLLNNDNVSIIRDTSMPIRADIITFSVCGSELTKDDYVKIKSIISQYDIYAKASGSLVTEGQTGRSTETGIDTTELLQMQIGSLGF